LDPPLREGPASVASALSDPENSLPAIVGSAVWRDSVAGMRMKMKMKMKMNGSGEIRRE
jgi:hypothetical protein